MFVVHAPVWDIVIRTAVVYLVVLVGLRLAGKREVGQLTVIDLVVLLLISNAVQNAMLGPDTSLPGGIISVVVLHGETFPDHLRREGLDIDTLQAALREHGVADVKDVEMAVLEIDGSISVVPGGQETKRVRHPMKYLRRS